MSKSRWLSWAFCPNEPYGFCGHKATLNRALHWSQFVPNMSTDVQGHEACLHHHHLHHLVLRFSWISTDGKAWSGVCVSLQASSATRHSCSPSSVHWRPIKISTCVTASMWHLSSAWRCRHRWSMPLSKLHSFCDLKIPVIALGSDVKYGFRWGGGGGGGGEKL